MVLLYSFWCGDFNLSRFFASLRYLIVSLPGDLLNPHLPSGPVHPYQLEASISNFKGGWCTIFYL